MSKQRLFLVFIGFVVAAGFATAVRADAGDLDPTFDGDGKVTLDLGSPYDGAYSVALQTDGKILVAGETTYAGAWNFALARYNRNGSLDPSFGSGGIVRTEFGWGTDVAVQRDGKIVMVGAGALPGGTTLNFAVARYGPDGTPDASFGSGGKAVVDFGLGDSAAAVAIQPDGKIVVVGRVNQSRTIDDAVFGVARLNADGNLDPSFDGDGRVLTEFTSFADGASDVELQRDGKLVVTGYAGFSRTGASTGTGAVARYNPDGSLDASFDGDGRVTTRADVGGSDVALQTDGKILLAGALVMRLNVDGTADSSFGQAGLVALDCMWARAIAVQPDRKIMVVGTTRQGDDLTLLRLGPGGRVDAGLHAGDCDGAGFTPGSAVAPLAAVLQPDRRIVVAGWTSVAGSDDRNFAVVRYLNPAPPVCVVPNVLRKTLRAAKASLAKSKCAAGRVTPAYSKTVKRGRVISQSVKPRTSRPLGTRVALKVSRGPRR